MSEADLIALLERRLAPLDDLVGPPSYSDFDLSGERPAQAKLRDASVLVPLITRETGLSVLLTRRSADMPTHSGQIAFPGGRRQAEDADAIATALREAREEVGLDPAHVRVLGASDPYETVTQFRVTPIVALVSHQADFVADPREVDAIFEVPFAFFMDPANHQRHSRDYNGQTRYYYAMPYGDHYVWGATAGMLRALYLRVYG
jgi:8-oxo-dGTP pyrophosphatase MutT (NUDIX family)